MYSNLKERGIDRDFILVLAISGIRSGSIVVVMVSLPFLLLFLNIPLALLGLAEAIGIMANFIMRIPAKLYVERADPELATTMALLSMGVSAIILYLARTFALIATAIFLLNASSALCYYGLKPKIDKITIGTENEKSPSLYYLATAIGPLVGLLLAASYKGSLILPIYGDTSIILLFAGVLGLPMLFFSKATRYRGPRTSPAELLKKPFKAMESISRIHGKDFLIIASLIQLVITLSLGSILVFLPAMAIISGLSREEIYLIFAAVGISSFILTYVGRALLSESFNRWFFMFKPLLVIIPLLLLSSTVSPEIFIVGYAITAMWAFVEPGSHAYVMSRFNDEDGRKVPHVMAFFNGPIMIVAPIMGAILWSVSARLLFAIAILPALIALLITIVAINSSRLSKPFSFM